MLEPTIPVLIDSIKQMVGFDRARCAYFRIEFDDWPTTWIDPDLHRELILIAPLGNWAVLVGPGRTADEDNLFTSDELIARTFESLEAKDDISLDLGHIWLPNELLGIGDKNNKIRAGDVYRLSLRLFHQCYRFIADAISEEEWLNSSVSLSDDIRPSLNETTAFRKWRVKEIGKSRERYRHSDYAERRLTKKGTNK